MELRFSIVTIFFCFVLLVFIGEVRGVNIILLVCVCVC